jgi:hypothetical protein
MKTLKLMLLFAGMSFLAVPNADAQQAKILSEQDGWRKIAETTVDFEKDKDVLMVFGKDRFRKLQFMAMDAPIEITTMVVHYEGGTHDTITVDSRIEEGGRSRVIDLQGDKPEIGRIVLNYKTSNENWQTGATSTDKNARNASTTVRKDDRTDMDTKTTVTTGTGTENETRTNTKVTTDDAGNTTVTDKRKTTETEVTMDKPARNTSTTTTTTTNDDLNKPGTQSATTNTTKQAGESKLNRSTKARLILWGLQ